MISKITGFVIMYRNYVIGGLITYAAITVIGSTALAYWI